MEELRSMERKILKVYLDNCCYNRPYDDQSEPRVYLESQAKMLIQDMIRNGQMHLVSSSVLDYEISRSPYDDRKTAIIRYIRENRIENIRIDTSNRIEEIANSVIQTGIKFYDAYHVACAVYAGCDYFLSTDKRLLKYDSDLIEMINPIDLIRKLEENNE